MMPPYVAPHSCFYTKPKVRRTGYGLKVAAGRRYPPIRKPRQRSQGVRFEEAITACREAAAVFQETSDQPGEGMALRIVFSERGATD
jgi:hypothetical protein